MIIFCNEILGRGIYKIVSLYFFVEFISDNLLDIIFVYFVFLYLFEVIVENWVKEFLRVFCFGGIFIVII